MSGVAALCIASRACARLTPRQIVAKLVADAKRHTARDPAFGYAGDPLRPLAGTYYGYLIRAAAY